MGVTEMQKITELTRQVKAIEEQAKNLQEFSTHYGNKIHEVQGQVDHLQKHHNGILENLIKRIDRLEATHSSTPPLKPKVGRGPGEPWCGCPGDIRYSPTKAHTFGCEWMGWWVNSNARKEKFKRYSPHAKELDNVPVEEHARGCGYIHGIGPYDCSCGAVERHALSVLEVVQKQQMRTEADMNSARLDIIKNLCQNENLTWEDIGYELKSHAEKWEWIAPEKKDEDSRPETEPQALEGGEIKS